MPISVRSASVAPRSCRREDEGLSEACLRYGAKFCISYVLRDEIRGHFLVSEKNDNLLRKILFFPRRNPMQRVICQMYVNINIFFIELPTITILLKIL